MKKFLFTLAALLMASTAFAESYLYVAAEDVVVTADDIANGTEIEVPVRANFAARVSAWDCEFTYPEGMNVVFAEKGMDADVTVKNARGRDAVVAMTLWGAADPYDHMIGTLGEYGYWQVDGAWVPYGVAKWEGGEHEEMLILYVVFDENYHGGEITTLTSVSSGVDERGGTVREQGDHAQFFTHSSGELEDPNPSTPVEKTDAPVITTEEVENGLKVIATGNGHITLYVEDILVAEGDGTAEYIIASTELEEEYGVSAYAQEDGKEISDPAVETVWVPAYVAPVVYTDMPVISIEYNYEEEYAMISATGNGTVKLYIDGMLVTNPFMYRFQDDEHEIVVTATAQEDGKEISETAEETYVIPAKTPVVEQTEKPVITWNYVEGGVEVTATGNGHICLYVEDILVAEGDGTASYVIESTELEEEYGVSATAQEDGKEISDPAVETVYVPGIVVPEKTDAPVITTEEVENGLKVIATGNGHICLYVEDILVAEGEGTAEYIIESTELEEEYGVSATAQENGKEVSDPAVETVWVPAATVIPEPYDTPAPEISTELTDEALVITATGEGTVTIYVQYIDNETGDITTETFVGDGTATAEVARGEEDTFINYWAVAQRDEEAYPGSTPVEYFVEVPALDGGEEPDPHATGWWIVLYDQYDNEIWYPLWKGSDESYTTTVTLDYGTYGYFYYDNNLSEDENDLNRPAVPFYFVVDGVAYGADQLARETKMGEAHNTTQNPLFNGEEMQGCYTVPVGYSYTLGIFVGDQYYVYCAQGPHTSVDEVNAGKTVAGVRYFNLAGQEMEVANGMTIVVTTYTDGTTSATKVMK